MVPLSNDCSIEVAVLWGFLVTVGQNIITALMQSMETSIVRFETLGSTNTEAANWAMQGAAEGFCIVADEQTAGRGRLDRGWISPKGAGLYLSIVLRPVLEHRSLPLITLMASLAVRDALSVLAGIQADIKWPNDVLVGERKICGILAEVIETTVGRAVVVGIGINVANGSFPPELIDSATTVEAVTGVVPDRERLIELLLLALSDRYDVLQAQNGEAVTLDAWCSASSFANGKSVVVIDGQQRCEGVTCGLERDGALRLKTCEGEIRTIRAGDVIAVRSASDRASGH